MPFVASSTGSIPETCGTLEPGVCEASCRKTPGCTVLWSGHQPDVAACCAACVANPSCRQFTFDQGGGKKDCHLRSANSPKTNSSGCVSGTIPAPPTPAPPPGAKNVLVRLSKNLVFYQLPCINTIFYAHACDQPGHYSRRPSSAVQCNVRKSTDAHTKLGPIGVGGFGLSPRLRPNIGVRAE